LTAHDTTRKLAMAAVVRPADHVLPYAALRVSRVPCVTVYTLALTITSVVGAAYPTGAIVVRPQALPSRRTNLGYTRVADGRFEGRPKAS